MSVGASSIKRAATTASKKPGSPAKKTSEKAVESEKKVVKKAVEKKPVTPDRYGIGDKLPIHLM